MDRITVRGIRAWGHHGVLPHERELGQEFVVDVEVGTDLSTAGTSDELEDTVDYGVLASDVADIMGGEPWQLVEALAARIAEHVLGHDLVDEVTVTVHKPSAPLPVPADEVAVTVTRR